MNLTTLTDTALAAASKRYDHYNNEGGEGYNPYTAEIEKRALAATPPAPRDRYDVLKDLERHDCSLARECGTYDEKQVAALRAELASLEAAE